MYNKITTYHNFSPHNDPSEMLKLKEILQEIVGTITERSDGVVVTVVRTTEFPQYKGKDIIQSVTIDSYDCVA